jgi:hypothetical protein
MIYTTTQIRKELPTLLQKALKSGQIQFKTRDGQVFVIRPLTPIKNVKSSPLDVRGIKLAVSREDILQFIRESRERY